MTRLFARALGCLTLVGHVLACSSDPDARYPQRPSQESSYIRDYFYAGGSWVDDGTGQGTRVLQGQMYVERLSPPSGATHPYPLVFVHGSGQTGTVRFAFVLCAEHSSDRLLTSCCFRFRFKNFLNTPDGRKGWASWLIDHGYEVSRELSWAGHEILVLLTIGLPTT